MATSDMIAIGILVLCTLLGVLGVFKWLLRLFAGLFVGALVLSCVALLVCNPKFDELSRGKFRGGVVIPYVRQNLSDVGDFIRGIAKDPPAETAISADDEKSNLFATQQL